jgi:hypothetical protein
MLHTLSCRYSRRSFLYAVPIGGLAGLIGLGGGEFRLPVAHAGHRLPRAGGHPAQSAHQPRHVVFCACDA